MIIYLRQYPEKVIIWWIIKPGKELPIVPNVSLTGIDTEITITDKTYNQ